MTNSTAPAVRVWRTVAESASLLGVSVRTLERRIADGTYEVTKVNGKRLVDCKEDATQEAKQLATAMAMGEEARQSAGMLTVMLQQSLGERTAEVAMARAETQAVRRMSVRAWQCLGVALSVNVGLALWLVSVRANDRQVCAKLAEVTNELEQETRKNEALEAKLESARVAQLTDKPWSNWWTALITP